MKSEMRTNEMNRRFPRLMINAGSNSVILFTSDCCGVLVWSSNLNSRHLGERYNTLNINNYRDYDGIIELSN